MGKIRLGIIGTGLAWERLHYPALQELGDKYEIAALCNRTKSEAEFYGRNMNLDTDNIYDDYNQLLRRDDLDAVDILVPIEMNYEVSEAAARAGKNIICEKPLAPDMSQAQKYLQLEKKYNIKVMIAENYRYNEENNKIKELVTSRKIGDVVCFMMGNITCFPCEMDKSTFAGTEWRQHPNFPGGAFLDAALHDIAGMRHIFGGVASVQAFGQPQKEDFNPYKSINVNIRFKGGVIGQYTYFPSGYEMQKPLLGFRIFGTNGEIYLEEKSSGVINVSLSDGSSQQVRYTPERGYYNELLNFYNAINGNEDVLVTPIVEFGDVKMVFDILKSIRENRAVFVDEPETQEYINFAESKQAVHPYIQ